VFKNINYIYENFDDVLKYTEDCRVLVVEDDKDLNKNIKEILEPFFNIPIEVAFNGQDAYKKYKEAFDNDMRFDIVITDIKMPYKNGIELTEDIKKVYEYQDIVVITAFDDTDQLIRLIDLNINKFILKPDIFDVLILEVIKIAKHINESKQLQFFIKKREEACKYSVCSLEPDDRFSVLIYSNDERTSTIYQDYLSKLCNTFFVFDKLDKAYEFLLKDKVSLILIDLDFENVSGYELAHKVSTNSLLCKLPMIFLSSNDIKNNLIESGYRLGAVDWIIKNSNYFYALFNRVRIYEELFIRKQELKSINDNLEIIIKNQTQELKEINQALEDRVKDEVDKNRNKDVIMFQQAKLASMGEMISNIAHQWRQPITAVSAIIQGIQLKTKLNKLDNDFVTAQTNQATDIIKKMSDTIDDFRDFFKPNKEVEEFCLREIIEKDLSFLKIIYEKNNIKLVDNLTGNCFIRGFKGEFTQVIMNILTNAKDVLVSQKQSDRVVVIEAVCGEQDATLTIQDNGGGIKDEIKDKIFDPYFTTKHQSQGTGIGLYMSRQIIQTHMSGSLDVSNSVFEYCGNKYFGAKFIIKLNKGDINIGS
jgi:signal transduction histidine kinase/AmiR/NasT family two-component response regulator